MTFTSGLHYGRAILDALQQLRLNTLPKESAGSADSGMAVVMLVKPRLCTRLAHSGEATSARPLPLMMMKRFQQATAGGYERRSGTSFPGFMISLGSSAALMA